MTIRELNGNYHKVPNDIHKIVNNTYELSVLLYLMRCCDGKNRSFPSYKTIASNLMSRYKCILSCQSLENKGYITIQHRNNLQSNVFTINIDKIVNDINQLTGHTSKPRKLVNNVNHHKEQKRNYTKGKYGDMVQE